MVTLSASQEKHGQLGRRMVLNVRTTLFNMTRSCVFSSAEVKTTDRVSVMCKDSISFAVPSIL
jgi:hypothetical protein